MLRSVRGKAPELVAVARILKPQGIRGEVRVESLTDNATRLTRPGRFILSRVPGVDSAPDDHAVELTRGRPHGRFFALKFAGVETMSDAEALRDLLVKVPARELAALPEGTFYLYEIIGAEVVTEDGARLGVVEEIMRGPAHDVYVVRGPDGESLLPATREVVRAVDRETRTITVRPPVYDEGGGRR